MIQITNQWSGSLSLVCLKWAGPGRWLFILWCPPLIGKIWRLAKLCRIWYIIIHLWKVWVLVYEVWCTYVYIMSKRIVGISYRVLATPCMSQPNPITALSIRTVINDDNICLCRRGCSPNCRRGAAPICIASWNIYMTVVLQNRSVY